MSRGALCLFLQNMQNLLPQLCSWSHARALPATWWNPPPGFDGYYDVSYCLERELQMVQLSAIRCSCIVTF